MCLGQPERKPSTERGSGLPRGTAGKGLTLLLALGCLGHVPAPSSKPRAAWGIQDAAVWPGRADLASGAQVGGRVMDPQGCRWLFFLQTCGFLPSLPSPPACPVHSVLSIPCFCGPSFLPCSWFLVMFQKLLALGL